MIVAWHEVPGKASIEKSPSRRVRHDRARLWENCIVGHKQDNITDQKAHSPEFSRAYTKVYWTLAS
jgi:hypothetical protein